MFCRELFGKRSRRFARREVFGEEDRGSEKGGGKNSASENVGADLEAFGGAFETGVEVGVEGDGFVAIGDDGSESFGGSGVGGKEFEETGFDESGAGAGAECFEVFVDESDEIRRKRNGEVNAF